MTNVLKIAESQSGTSEKEAHEQALKIAFPEVDPGAVPCGQRILVQWRRAKERTTASGLILVEETKDTEKANNPVAKIIAVGSLAYKKRDTLEPWPEGAWISVGEYARVPRWGGDKWEVPFINEHGEKDFVTFSAFNDHEVIAKITGNPLEVRSFV